MLDERGDDSAASSLMVLAAIAAVATVLTLALPLMQGDTLGSA